MQACGAGAAAGPSWRAEGTVWWSPWIQGGAWQSVLRQEGPQCKSAWGGRGETGPRDSVGPGRAQQSPPAGPGAQKAQSWCLGGAALCRHVDIPERDGAARGLIPEQQAWLRVRRSPARLRAGAQALR